VSNLHVGDEGETVGHEHVTPALEQHHGNGATGKHVTDDELGNDVETGLLTGDSLNDT
jgi:hypothetical protein